MLHYSRWLFVLRWHFTVQRIKSAQSTPIDFQGALVRGPSGRCGHQVGGALSAFALQQLGRAFGTLLVPPPHEYRDPRLLAKVLAFSD